MIHRVKIIYKALWMKENLKEMPRDQVFLKTLEDQREEAHQELQHKAPMEGQEKKKRTRKLRKKRKEDKRRYKNKEKKKKVSKGKLQHHPQDLKCPWPP